MCIDFSAIQDAADMREVSVKDDWKIEEERGDILCLSTDGIILRICLTTMAIRGNVYKVINDRKAEYPLSPRHERVIRGSYRCRNIDVLCAYFGG